jgi:hypothetical protein
MDKAQSQAPTRSLVSIDDVGKATAFLALDGAKLITLGWACLQMTQSGYANDRAARK